jgi:hypothetical protein
MSRRHRSRGVIAFASARLFPQMNGAVRIVSAVCLAVVSVCASVSCAPPRDCAIIEGDFTEGDLACAAEVREVTGSLTLSTDDTDAGDYLDFPKLQKVGGSVLRGARVVRLPALERVGGDLQYSDPVGHHAGITIELPELTGVGGDFLLVRYPGAVGLNVPKLRAVGGKLEVAQVTHMMSLGAPALVSTGGDLTVSSSGELSNGGWLDRVSFGSLVEVGGRLDVHHNAKLAKLALPKLARVGNGLAAHENPRLPQCELDALATRLQRHCDCAENNPKSARCSATDHPPG